MGDADAAALSRYETDDTVTIIGGWSRSHGYIPIGTRHPLGRGTLGRLVSETRRPGLSPSAARRSSGRPPEHYRVRELIRPWADCSCPFSRREPRDSSIARLAAR
jgi:hypothetical protein